MTWRQVIPMSFTMGALLAGFFSLMMSAAGQYAEASQLIMLSMVLSYAGLPIEGLGLVAGIDAVLDMARTCINVTGDMCVSTVVAKTEGETLKD